jgi:ribonucleoside-triphosphate reductase|tara:strand:+ start:2601 stop:4607 length:2007 start_codon:yes stop_codon:yes gene_type:complete
MLSAGAETASRLTEFNNETTTTQEAKVPDDVKQAFELNDKYFAKEIQKFQALDKFARFDQEKGRRETWPETVNRTMDFFYRHCELKGYQVPESTWAELQSGLLNLRSSPSMRCVQMAGPSLDRCHVGVYNCSFQFLQSTQDMAEELYILMQGTGVGFSVEHEFSVEKFPRVERQKPSKKLHHVIADTTEGWCAAYQLGLDTWWSGGDIEFDYSQIRESGAPLKIKGGKASGPGPLKDLMSFARKRILARQGETLTSVDLFDINCYAHRIVRMGGVRRASGISLSDLGDQHMRDCKQGEFWTHNEQRNQANNSAVYDEKPDAVTWMEEWLSLAKSGSGERGIFNRGALQAQFPARRKTEGIIFGTNPCGEIILRHKQFCNLSIAVLRPTDTYEEIETKVIQATIWGTLQSTMTDFNYIGKEWKDNSEEERLLGVDLLGFLDHPLFQDNETAAAMCQKLQKVVNAVNREWAENLGIPASAATTCIKPSGDSSVFFDTAAGFKGHHGEYYVRRTRSNSTNPVALMLRDAGVPCHQDYDGSGLVLEWPMKSPETGVMLESQTAISQLEKWKVFKLHWTEHNPSVTIYVRPDEWLDVGKWVYDNWENVGGLSFLPYDGGVYHLAPYEAIDKAEYDKRLSEFPSIDWASLVNYEKDDMTDLHQQVACTGGGCDI